MKQVIILIALIALSFLIFNGIMAIGGGGNSSIEDVHIKVRTIDNIVEDPSEYIEHVKEVRSSDD